MQAVICMSRVCVCVRVALVCKPLFVCQDCVTVRAVGSEGPLASYTQISFDSPVV